MTTTLPLQNAATFPQVEVENRLRDHLSGIVRQQANVKGQALPTELKVLLTTTVDIDSLGVVEILCVLDEVLDPVLVDESVVRAGGYSSIQQALADLVP